MESINKLWVQYNKSANKLAAALDRTSNLVGEFAELLAFKHYGGEQLKASGASADIKGSNGKLYQVKSRKIDEVKSTQLNVIRSWDFDYLVVILFSQDGKILKALEIPCEVAKKYGKQNDHQNGWIITTSQEFLKEKEAKNITKELKEIQKAL